MVVPSSRLLPDQLVARGDPERGVEVRERLVEQEDLGLADDGAAERHALPLAARERLRLAAQEGCEAQLLGHGPHPALDLGARDPPPAQPESDVLEHGHVRVEGVGLEHHGDVPVLGRHRVHHPAVDAHLARGDRLEPGDHAERRRLAAAGRAEQHHELAVRDREVEVPDGGLAAVVALGEPLERDRRQRRAPGR